MKNAKAILVVLLGALFGVAACDKVDPGASLVEPTPSDAGVGPDLSGGKDASTEPQAGEVMIDSKTAPLGKIVAGSRYELSWLVDTVTLRSDTYHFSMSGIDVKGASGNEWKQGITFDPADAEIMIGKPVLIKATVTVPAGAQSAKLVMRAESTGGIKGNAFPLLLVVGEVAEITDPRALFTTLRYSALDGRDRNANILIDGTPVSGIQVAFGQIGPIRDHLVVDSTAAGAAGAFRFSVDIEGSPADWGATVNPDHIDYLDAGQDLPLSVNLDNKIQNGSLTPSFLVIRAAHRVSPGAAMPDYTSLIRIPIQGFIR